MYVCVCIYVYRYIYVYMYVYMHAFSDYTEILESTLAKHREFLGNPKVHPFATQRTSKEILRGTFCKMSQQLNEILKGTLCKNKHRSIQYHLKGYPLRHKGESSQYRGYLLQDK